MGYKLRGYIYKSISNMGYDRLSGLIYHLHLDIHAGKGWEGRSLITQSMSWIGNVCKENRDIWNLQIFHTKKSGRDGLGYVPGGQGDRIPVVPVPGHWTLTNHMCFSFLQPQIIQKSRCGAVATSTPTRTIWFYRLPTCMAQLGRQIYHPHILESW